MFEFSYKTKLKNTNNVTKDYLSNRYFITKYHNDDERIIFAIDFPEKVEQLQKELTIPIFSKLDNDMVNKTIGDIKMATKAELELLKSGFLFEMGCDNSDIEIKANCGSEAESETAAEYFKLYIGEILSYIGGEDV